MIKYIKHEYINFKLWDKCIDNSINSYIYAYSWYLNIVAEKWDALIEDDYKSVFPIPYRKKFGIKYIYQPVFTQQLGLFSTITGGNGKLKHFIEAIPKEFKLIEINLNKYYISDLIIKSKNIIENKNFELDLSSDYQSLKSNYSNNLKRNIKKAEKHNLYIAEYVKPEEITDLFKQNKGAELNAYSQEDYKKLIRLMYMLLYKSRAQIIGAYSNENNLIASALIVNDKNRYIFLFSGLNNEGKEKSAMPFLIDYYLKKHSRSNKVFDFEGSNSQSLARFYSSFGSKEFKYFGLRIYRYPIKFIKNISLLIRTS